MRLAPLGQRRDQYLGAVEHALYFQLHELLRAHAQSLGGRQSLGLYQLMYLLTQRLLTHPNKPPRLHQANAGRVVRRLQQPLQ